MKQTREKHNELYQSQLVISSVIIFGSIKYQQLAILLKLLHHRSQQNELTSNCMYLCLHSLDATTTHMHTCTHNTCSEKPWLNFSIVCQIVLKRKVIFFLHCCLCSTCIDTHMPLSISSKAHGMQVHYNLHYQLAKINHTAFCKPSCRLKVLKQNQKLIFCCPWIWSFNPICNCKIKSTKQ